MRDSSPQSRSEKFPQNDLLRYLVSAVIVLGGIGLFLFLKSLAKAPEDRPSNTLIQQVRLAEVQPFAGQIDLMVSGTVVPHREIDVVAEVSGQIVKKFPECQAGLFVTTGTKLVEIDAEEFAIDISRLEANVQQSRKSIAEIDSQITGEQTNLELALEDLKLQQAEYDRNKRLRGVISQSELDDSQRALNAARTQVAARESAIATLQAGKARLESALKLSQRQVEMGELKLRRTVIVAPMDGIIVSEGVQENDYIRQGDSVITLEDVKKAEVRINLTRSDLNWIRDNSPKEKLQNLTAYQLPETEVRIFDASEPDVIWTGTLKSFDGIGRDPITKTFPCRVIIDKPVAESDAGTRVLVRGMFVKCQIEVQTSMGDEVNDLVAFSELGLHPDGRVWLVRDNKLASVAVDVIDRSQIGPVGAGESRVIARESEGKLSAGDQVIISPLSQPTEGAEVEIAEPVTSPQ